jgi:hypothetical protein
LAVAFTEDLSADFYVLKSAGGLADPATFGGATVPVFFDNEYLMAHDMVSTTNPVARALASDFDSSDVGSTITISGLAYTIRDVQPLDDGTEVLLQLEKQ